MPSPHVIDAGSGPAVVLVHPGPGLDASVFFPGAGALADAGFRVLAIDLPGNGRSPAGEPTLTGFARAVEQLARELGLRDWTLLGHSFGGYVAAQHLVDFPSSAARRVLSCTDVDEEPPPGLPDPFADLDPEVEAAFEREATVATPEDCRQVWLAQLPFFAVHPGRAASMLVDVVFSPEMHHSRDWGELHALDALAATPVPVLAITGERDPVCPLPTARRIADTAPRGELMVVEDAGHFPFAEQPERYWGGLVEWLRRAGTAA